MEYPILEYQVTAVGGTKPSGSNETAWEDSGGGFSNVRSGQVRFITRPKSRTMRAKRN